MTDTPSLAVRLFGTEEAVEAPLRLSAGALTAELEAGNLRYIRYGSVELIRAISFIVRDKDWGTYNPAISQLKVEEDGNGFRVTYEALAGDAGQGFGYSASIRGTSDGKLVFHCVGKAQSPFLTNRTGFVVLHPIEGVAGEPVEITHVDGKVVQGRFPAEIDPVQPMMNLRALAHQAAPGVKVHCLMEGDTFEMEDQRNWSDASYKTYVRPLALPWPYTLATGETIDQTVTLEITGTSAATSGGDGITLSLGEAAGSVPPLGAGLDPDDSASALAAAATLKQLGLNHLVCHHDPRRGHDAATLARQIEVARAIGAEPWLEAVVATVDGYEEEVASLGAIVASLGSPFATVLVSPASDLKSTLPGSPWPPCPPLDGLYRAARRAFGQARLGGGMFSYFTELNRKHPPLDTIDIVGFTTSAMVHAGDDRSVMESLQALPAIALTTATIAGHRPFIVGPSAIGMRANPYGDKPKNNPGNIRQAMNRNDPRQRGLVGAAWDLGYFARFAYGGAEAIALGGLTGPFGIIHAQAAYPQPGYDGKGGLFPAFHILRGLAALRGKPLRRLTLSHPSQVLGVAAESKGGVEIWLANLTASAQHVALGTADYEIAVLDAGHFSQAAARPDALDALSPGAGKEIELAAYAVARLRLR